MQTTVREKPIIFDAESVRAILEGRKTMTRRVVKPQPPDVVGPMWTYDFVDPAIARLSSWPDGKKGFGERVFECHCPYPVGTRLWCRETWVSGDTESCDCPPTACLHRPQVHYRADWCGLEQDVRWNSPIHMPKWAARITLEVVNVRVERVQEISRSDAVAEGFVREPCLPIHPCDWFRERWNTINAKRGYPWEANCWVWVIEFKRLENEP